MRAIVVSLAVMLCAVTSTSSFAQGPRPWASKVPKELANKPNPVPITPDTLAKGKEVFTNTCLPCHGEMGLGDGPAAEFMTPKPKPLINNGKVSVPDGVAFWVITNGIDGTGMASLSDTLNETERWQVIRYLATLAAPAAPPSTPAPAVTAAPVVSPVAAATPETKAPPAATPTLAPKKAPGTTK